MTKKSILFIFTLLSSINLAFADDLNETKGATDQDVIDYIQKSNADFEEKMAALNKKIADLKNKMNNTTNSLSTLENSNVLNLQKTANLNMNQQFINNNLKAAPAPIIKPESLNLHDFNLNTTGEVKPAGVLSVSQEYNDYFIIPQASGAGVYIAKNNLGDVFSFTLYEHDFTSNIPENIYYYSNNNTICEVIRGYDKNISVGCSNKVNPNVSMETLIKL